MKNITSLAVVALASTALVACGAEETGQEASGGDTVTIENCGNTWELTESPERVTLLNAPAVPTLDALGVLDRAVAKAGAFPEPYYSDEVNEALAEVDTISDQLDGGGHLQISLEAVVATDPDLIIGSTDSITSDTISGRDTVLVQEPVLCGAAEGDATWEDVNDHVDLYAEIFREQEAGEEFKAELQQQVEEIEASVPQDEDRSIAVLWPTVGGGVTYAYGTGSMSNQLAESAGLENVFADQSDRVFEVNAEQIVAREPDVILALYSEGDPEAVAQAIRDLNGAEAIPAVADDQILPMLLNFAEAPSSLNVDGLEQLIEYLEGEQ